MAEKKKRRPRRRGRESELAPNLSAGPHRAHKVAERAATARTGTAVPATRTSAAPPSKCPVKALRPSQPAVLAAKERKRARRQAKKSRVRVDNSSCPPQSSQATIACSPPPPTCQVVSMPHSAVSPAKSSSVWRSSSAFTTPPPRYACLRAPRPAPAFSQDTCYASPDTVAAPEVRPKEEEVTLRASLPRKAKEAEAIPTAVKDEPRSPPYWRRATAQLRGIRARLAANPKKRPPAVADIRLSASARAADASRRKWLVQQAIADQWLNKRKASLRSAVETQNGGVKSEGGGS